MEGVLRMNYIISVPPELLVELLGLQNNKIINELCQANLSRVNEYSFLKTYGKFEKCFDCATYTDSTFLTTDKNAKV